MQCSTLAYVPSAHAARCDYLNSSWKTEAPEPSQSLVGTQNRGHALLGPPAVCFLWLFVCFGDPVGFIRTAYRVQDERYLQEPESLPVAIPLKKISLPSPMTIIFYSYSWRDELCESPPPQPLPMCLRKRVFKGLFFSQ